MLPSLFLAAAVGYILGALPFGYVVARAKGVNIFEVGSRNPGATNVRRVLGSGPGNLVLFLDVLKGALAAGWPLCPFMNGSGATSLEMGVAGLVAATLGHGYSCFTGFRGGKSVATAGGGFAVLFPAGIGIALVVFLVTVGTSRYVSLGSCLAAASLPIAAFFLHQPTLLVVSAAVVGLFVIVRHRANISRLLAGTESKIGQKAAASAGSVPPKP
jgi:glycerol-3-phosphate acyltransferase PlsY